VLFTRPLAEGMTILTLELIRPAAMSLRPNRRVLMMRNWPSSY
jgi:hypothetical protein